MSWSSRTLIVLLCLFLLLGGCSRASFLYERADWLGARWVANFLDLDREQRRWVRDELGLYQEQFRQQRLPEVERFLKQVIADIEQQHHSAQEIGAQFEAAESLLREIGRDVLPATAEILSELNAKQLDHLDTRFEERDKERQKEQEKRQERSEEERRERLRSGLEDWLGESSDEQEALLQECGEKMPDVAEAQADWERARQSELLQRLRAGEDKAAIESYLSDWWLERIEQDSALQDARTQRRELFPHCLSSLFSSLSDSQRQHLIDKLDGYLKDVQRIIDAGKS